MGIATREFEGSVSETLAVADSGNHMASPVLSRVDHRRYRQAVLATGEYLLSQVSQGAWSDFLTNAGESAEWCSAFVAFQLIKSGLPPSRLSNIGATLLRRQRVGGGWGYNSTVPADSDSTAWSIRALSAIAPVESRAAQVAAISHLRNFIRRNGFTTFAAPADVRSYLGLGDDADVAGWCGIAHSCVTASVALALGRCGPCEVPGSDSLLHTALDGLRATQHASGCWNGYWWRTPMYATTMAVEALTRSGLESDLPRIRAGLAWVAREQQRDGSWDSGDGEGGAFVTGLATQCLASQLAYHHSAERGARWLLRALGSGASWKPCPILQIAAPWVKDPRSTPRWTRGGLGVSVCISDQHRLFTTAVCRAALAAMIS